MIRPNLESLLNDVTVTTTSYLREFIFQDDYAEFTPILEHAIDSVVPGSDRALIVKLGCELYGGNEDIALPGMAAYELLNINLLVTDDFFDSRSSSRMGVDTIQSRWGDEVCISLGFILKSIASELLIQGSEKNQSWKLSDALGVFEWATKWLYYSQFQEIRFNKKHPDEITFDMYMDLIRNATAIGIAGAFELGCILGGGSADQRNISRNIGMNLGYLLQIRDDLIDYIYDENMIKKGPFNDIIEKKMRLPLLVAWWVGSTREHNVIDAILQKEQIYLDDILKLLEIITSGNCKDYIRIAVAEMKDNTLHDYSHLPNQQPANEIVLELIELFTDL